LEDSSSHFHKVLRSVTRGVFRSPDIRSVTKVINELRCNALNLSSPYDVLLAWTASWGNWNRRLVSSYSP